MTTDCSALTAPTLACTIQRILRTGLLVLATCGVLIGGDVRCLYSQTRSSATAKTNRPSAQGPHEPDRRVSFAHPALTFEPNLGQDPSQARFISYGRGFELRLEQDRASVVFSSQARGTATANESTIGLQLLAPNLHAAMLPQERIPGEHSYFPSGDPKSWITHIPQFGRVTYQGVYSGVDLSFYGNSGRLEYDFILQPNADAGRVQLATQNGMNCRVDTHGDLGLSSHDASITLLRPLAYQLSADGSRHEPIPVQYRVRRDGTSGSSAYRIGFSIGKYDHRRPLVIDPVMIYGLDIPGAAGYSYPPYYFADTNISAMTADAAGNTYVAATVGNSYASTNVLKYDPAGHLLFNASLGTQTTSIQPLAIAVNAAGDVYLAGQAGAGLPTTTGAFEPTFPGSEGAAFIAVIKADGSALTYSSYLGGNLDNGATGLAVDSAGQAYMTGYTQSSNFPTTAGAYQTAYPVQDGGEYAEFVAKFNPTLTGNASLVYSTFLSGYGSSQGLRIAVDGPGDAYVISSAAPGFPVTQGAYNFDGPSNTGAYISKLNPSGTNLLYSAYLGPAIPDGIAVDGSGEAYVAGSVTSTNFPVTTGAYQTSYPGGFALKMNSAGSALVYSTYLSGPSGYEMKNVIPSGIAIAPGCASACEAYISGTTTTSDFPLIEPIQSFSGAYGLAPSVQTGSFTEGFLVGLGATGKTSSFSTYLGGASSPTNGSSFLPAVAVDSAGNVYFASNIEGSDAPVTLPAVQYPGYGFLAKISPTNAGATVAIPGQVTFATLQPVKATTTTGGTVELRNLGSAAVALTRPFVVSSPEFAETDNCPASIPGGGICAVNVSFTPAVSGQRSGTLSIRSNGRNSPTVVALSGTAIDAPNLQLSATSLSFADQVVTTASTAQVVTLTNSGDLPQPIATILTETSDFKTTSNCPAQIAAGASCQVSVVFSPAQIGLVNDDLIVQIPGLNDYVTLEGTGVLATTGNGTLQFSSTALNFGNIVLSQPSAMQEVALMNTGTSPVTINSLSVSTTAGEGNSGDFRLAPLTSTSGFNEPCGDQYVGSTFQPYNVPFVVEPQTSCTIYVGFQPSISGQEAGTLTITDSAVGSPHSLGLSGIGLSSEQPLAISPSTMTFPALPVGDPSAAQTFTITNPGNESVMIDRAFTTGDFGVANANGGNCGGSTLGSQDTCAVNVLFDPTVTGSRTGTLTLTDSISGTPSVFNLAGTGIKATGALVLGQTSLAFESQDEGTTSESEEVLVSNPGNSPVTINSIETTSEFALVSQYPFGPSACGGMLAPDSVCAIDLAFSPTQPSGSISGSLIIHSTAGTVTVSLSGTSVETAQAIHITPTTINFGGAMVGSTSSNNYNTIAVTVYIDNTGGAPVTFPTAPTIMGTAPAPGSDFEFADVNCFQYIPIHSNANPGPMPPGGSCSFTLTFSPSLAATEKATFALTDSAGKQTIALSGAGMSTNPSISLQPPVLAFGQLAVGASSPDSYTTEINVYNSGSQSVTISSVSVSAGSADFSQATGYGYCTGYTLTPGEECDAVFLLHPSAVGYRTGTATFTDSSGNHYTAALAGYGVAAVDAANLTPQALIMPSAPVQPEVGSNDQATVTLNNTGNTPLTIGTVAGTNISTTGDFPATSSYCTGVSVPPGNSCSVYVAFEPRATGQRTGSLTFPVTYADKTTATLTATLSGIGQTASGSATLSPQTAAFAAAVAGTGQTNYQNSVTIVLTNTGNVQLTTGAISGTDLTTTAGTGGDFVGPSHCSNLAMNPGNSCTIYLNFVPLTVGLKTGTISVPVTYSGGTTATLTSALSGQGLAAAPVLQVSPSELAFNPEVVGTVDSTNTQIVTLNNTGNASVTIKSVTVSPNFTITNNGCGTTITTQISCTVTVGFAPLATTTPGTVSGTLSIVDNAPGSPHVVKLSGKAISAAQELALSQSTVTFANQEVGTVSAGQVVYLTDLDTANASTNTYSDLPSRIQINSIALGGANASDFTETQTCGGDLGFTILGRTYCEITVAFAPGAASFGPRTATVSITPAQGSALVITLKGNAYGSPAVLTAPTPGRVLTGPKVTFSWAAATGATGYTLRLGTTPGANNLYASGEITTTSATPTSLTTNGETIYATLFTFYDTVQVSNGYTFTAATQAAVTSPVPGGTLSSLNQAFAWTAGVGATSYSMWLGTTGRGSSNLYTSGPRTTTAVTVPGLPANGETVCVRLITNFNGVLGFRIG